MGDGRLLPNGTRVQYRRRRRAVVMPNRPVVVSAVSADMDARGFRATDDANFHDLYNGREYYDRQQLTDAERRAAENYIQSDTEYGSLYSHSQNLNWLMMQNAASGRPITAGMNAKQLATYNGMMSAMHNLGYNVNLTRYDHETFVNNLLSKAGLGGVDYSTLTERQLKNALTGIKYGEERLIATSYNNFKNAPDNTKGVFMNRAVRIEYRAKAGTQAMMPGNGPGGRIGEVVMAPSGGRENFRVVDVKYDDNVRVRKKGTRGLSRQKQLVVVVEV